MEKSWKNVLLTLAGFLAVFNERTTVNGCFFRTSSWNHDSSLNSSNSAGNGLPIGLDKETISVVQQTLVKTLISLGKLRFHCPRGNGTYADLLDCRKYYNCISGSFTIGLCEPGHGYEVLAKSCIPAERVSLCQKVKKLEDYKCLNETGLKVFEGSCEKFILCTGDETDGGTAYASTCNHGDVFDQGLKLCLPENEANCTIPIPTNSSSSVEVKVPTPTNGTEVNPI